MRPVLLSFLHNSKLYQSEPRTSPSRGNSAWRQVLGDRPALSERTLPSASATFRVWWPLCTVRLLQHSTPRGQVLGGAGYGLIWYRKISSGFAVGFGKPLGF